MKYFLLLFFAMQATYTSAQSSCSSDQAASIQSITERFTNADCEACWKKPLPTELSTTTLDWILPSASGDDAPLSAAANRDALARLDSLKINLPKEQRNFKTKIGRSTFKLRVAHGLAVNGYIGASMALTQFPALNKNLKAVLLLTETIPKGTADSPVERTLVRNMLIESWTVTTPSSPKDEKQVLLMRRPLSIPPGVNPDNLHVLGWVEDENGFILAATQSLCIEEK
jgi:hypothetical protein